MPWQGPHVADGDAGSLAVRRKVGDVALVVARYRDEVAAGVLDHLSGHALLDRTLGTALHRGFAVARHIPGAAVIAMPRMNGIEAAKRVRKHLPETKIIILSMYSHEHYIQELLETGISGYLLKDSSGRDIIKAIHAAIKHETFLSPSISKVVVNRYLFPRKCTSKEERFKLLSNREREVFQLIAEGHSTKKIGDMLCVSPSTVKTHRSKIREKLAIESPVQLYQFAIQLGLVDPDL